MLIEEIFCSPVTIENRHAVRVSEACEVPCEEEIITGCIFEPDGSYIKYYMRYSLDNLARFICSNEKDKIVCNGDDHALCNTQGEYLDLCIKDAVFQNSLVSTLKKYQGHGFVKFDEMH